MCGIIGFSWQDASLARKMCSSIKHRGPDDSGIYSESNITLGHQRLSIIDLSKKGHQPMFNEDKSIVIVFNGEIWNYPELKLDLKAKGHKFTSNSDTEVIVHGYEEYGEKICKMLDGMFAFAIWDKKKKAIFIGRDKIGKKPLYYYHDKNQLIFASEIKAILEHKIPRKINQDCLSDYLSLRFSPDSITMFQGIQKLPAGSHATFKSGKLNIQKFYKIPEFTARYKEDRNKADELIQQSIKRRLISDVPIGVFLSGGLDSSAITAYMSRLSKNVHTFSVGFDSSVDETKYARIISNKFKTKHKEIRLDKDILKFLPKVIWHFDEPLADPAALPTFLLCKAVSKDVKVALSGEGGDEVFGGYDTFNLIPKLKLIHSLPYPIRYLASKLSKNLSNLYKYPNKQILLLLSEIFADRSINNNFKRLFYFPFNSEDKKAILSNAKSKDAFDAIQAKNNSLDITAQEYYFNEWLPNDLLMKADKMSMSSGLEVRTPFLDKDLIEYFSGLPYQSKHKRSLFRSVVSRYLPSIIMSKKKQGFTLPLTEWFQDAKTFNRIKPFIDKLKARNIFNKEEIENILSNPKEFKNEHKLWVLLNFEIWYEIFMEKINYKKIKL